jgi:hypothetical protein
LYRIYLKFFAAIFSISAANAWNLCSLCPRLLPGAYFNVSPDQRVARNETALDPAPLVTPKYIPSSWESSAPGRPLLIGGFGEQLPIVLKVLAVDEAFHGQIPWPPRNGARW